ncbi:hypothetical protein N0M98_18135 [Paenibacillus doosanensis]|nr:hypothetical protein [Paenibacillus doosanensis]MCS7462061.1 hypothetical protein [Paenibacillus doosanensis]
MMTVMAIVAVMAGVTVMAIVAIVTIVAGMTVVAVMAGITVMAIVTIMAVVPCMPGSCILLILAVPRVDRSPFDIGNVQLLQILFEISHLYHPP